MELTCRHPMELSFAKAVLLHVFVKIIFFHGPTMVGTWIYSHLAVIMRALNYIFPVFFSLAKPFLAAKG